METSIKVPQEIKNRTTIRSSNLSIHTKETKSPSFVCIPRFPKSQEILVLPSLLQHYSQQPRCGNNLIGLRGKTENDLMNQKANSWSSTLISGRRRDRLRIESKSRSWLSDNFNTRRKPGVKRASYPNIPASLLESVPGAIQLVRILFFTLIKGLRMWGLGVSLWIPP